MAGKSIIGRLPILLSAALLMGAPLAHAADTYDIPVVISMSGSGAFLGNQEHTVLQLVEKVANQAGDIHGKKLHFVFHDDQSSPQVAVQLTAAIVAEHPAVMMGSSIAATCDAMTPLVKNGPVMYCFSAAVQPAAGGFVYSAGASTRAQAEALLRYFQGKGWKRIAFITSTDATGQDGDRGYDALLAEPAYADLKRVANLHFADSDVSIAAQAAQIQAANPQAVIVWSTGTPSATAFRGLIQAGIDLPVGTVGSNMTFAQMKRYAAFLPKELYIPNPEWSAAGDPKYGLPVAVAERQKALYAAYDQAGIKVDAPAIVAWDPAMLLIGILRALPAGATAEQIRAHIAQLTAQPGVDGLYNFTQEPQRGLSVQDILVTRWDKDANRWSVVSKPSGLPLSP